MDQMEKKHTAASTIVMQLKKKWMQYNIQYYTISLNQIPAVY